MGQVERRSHDLARNLEINRHEFEGVAGIFVPTAVAFANTTPGTCAHRQAPSYAAGGAGSFCSPA
jgi:hypothetical protein